MKQYKKHSTNYRKQKIQVHILPKHPHVHTPTHQKQVKTTTVQDTHKWYSNNTIKYPQYKFTLM